jgi:hypothetical protein
LVVVMASGVEGFELGDRHGAARELAARAERAERRAAATIARLREELSDALARAVRAEDKVRRLQAALEAAARR